MAKLGAQFNTYTVYVRTSDKQTYESLTKILHGEKLKELRVANNIDYRIIGRDPSFDSLGLAADLCDMEDSEMKYGDLVVVFMRQPQISVVEEKQVELLDIASLLLNAIEPKKVEEAVV